MLASAFILALLVLRICTETHAADLYPPPPAPQPRATRFHGLNWFSAALAHEAHWVDACYFNNCAHSLQWIGEDGGVRRLMRIEWFRWFQPNVEQLLGCEIQPDGVLHCKDYVTNADSFWTLGFDG